MHATAIELTNLTKKMGDQTILNNVSLKVKKREIYGLAGENEAGKSTLMRIIFHILNPTDGDNRIRFCIHSDKRCDKKDLVI